MSIDSIPPLWMGIPFAGTLFSIAFFPLWVPKLWHKFENLFLYFWGICGVILMGGHFGWNTTFQLQWGMLWHEYIPFMAILLAIFVINGGLHIHIKMTPSTLFNLLYISIASLLASLLGTTGASMLFLRPFLRLNQHKALRVHHVVFFIFIVANIGGGLTPLGDPPLFIGFLNGVDFFWPLRMLWKPFLYMWGSLLILYGILDWYLLRGEPVQKVPFFFSLEGKRNLIFLIGLMFFIPYSSFLPFIDQFSSFGTKVSWNQLVRDGVLLLMAFLSYFITPEQVHRENHFTWGPVKEVGRIFFVIFSTIIPVSMMLKAGKQGPFYEVLSLAEGQHATQVYFWLTGLFSAFLDNAPTYLVFFQMAGGNANYLMNDGSSILIAISLGSVFMGAMTYIGNTPNFMIRSIAKQGGIVMPSFVGYMGWSVGILIPLFILLSFLCF